MAGSSRQSWMTAHGDEHALQNGACDTGVRNHCVTSMGACWHWHTPHNAAFWILACVAHTQYTLVACSAKCRFAAVQVQRGHSSPCWKKKLRAGRRGKQEGGLSINSSRHGWLCWTNCVYPSNQAFAAVEHRHTPWSQELPRVWTGRLTCRRAGSGQKSRPLQTRCAQQGRGAAPATAPAPARSRGACMSGGEGLSHQQSHQCACRRCVAPYVPLRDAARLPPRPTAVQAQTHRICCWD